MKKRLRLRLEPEASEELRAAVKWYEERRAGLGTEFLAEVNSVLERIRQFPGIGAFAPSVPKGLGVRTTPVGRFPYSVAFLEQEGLIRVIAIAHSRRRPGYWRYRLQ